MKTTRKSSAQDWLNVAEVAAAGLREGALKLKDLVGLSAGEMNVVAEHAEALRRRGRHADAGAVYALLLTYDPTNAHHWRRLGDLHQSTGDHVVAVAGYETAALLGGRERSSTDREALSLEQLGQAQLVSDLHELAAAQMAAERGAR